MTAPERLPLILIAAVARNGVIGAGDALPWRLPSDLRHFKAATMGRPVLMGRKTYQSIGRPLPGRTLIVVSADPHLQAPGAIVAGSIETALAEGEAAAAALQAPAIMVAGGGMLYRALIGRAERLLITAVDLAPAGDTHFPPIDPAVWREAASHTPPPDPRDEAPFAFTTYERRA